MFLARSFDSSLTSNMVGQCRVPFFPMWFLLTPILVFDSFNYFILPSPMNMIFLLFIVDWLWSLSNYQCYLLCPFPYNTSIFYTFLFILSILSIMSISIHVHFHFDIFCHFYAFLFVLSILFNLSKSVVDYYLFVVHYICPSLFH